VLYTDGLIESGRDVIAGGRNLLQRLAASPFGAEELVGQLVGTDHHDDIAVLIFSVSSPTVASSWRFEADDSRSAAHARSSFVAHLHQLQADEQTIEFAGTVFGELVANVVRHASGPIEIELVRENGDLFLYVRDRGPHFVAGDASLPADIMSEGGRGLFLVRSHASMPVVKRRFGGGNEIHVRLHSRRRDKNAE
jgi:anti-sigma regulatory factor (Ser/Thr protein kinase)